MKILFFFTINLLILTGCASKFEEMKSTFSNYDTKSSGTKKEIKIQSKIASLSNDIKCETLVEPYDYVGNIASITTLAAKVESIALLGTGMKGKDRLDIYKNGFKQLNWMPVSMEIELGDAMHKKRADILPKKGKNAKDYEKAESLLKSITSNIPDTSSYNFSIYLIRGNDKSAEALPGGKIYITKSVLSNNNYAKMTIAHEIAHTLKRHYTMEYQTLVLDLVDNIDTIKSIKSSITQSSDKESNKGINLIYTKIASTAVTKEFLFNIARDFTKNQELEADSCALKLLSDEPNYFIIANNFYTNLSKSSSKKDRKLLDFDMYDHPTSQERLDNLKERISEIKVKK